VSSSIKNTDFTLAIVSRSLSITSNTLSARSTESDSEKKKEHRRKEILQASSSYVPLTHLQPSPVDAALPSENAVIAVSDEEDEAAPLLSLTPAVVEVRADAPLLMLLSMARPTDAPRVEVREGGALAFTFGLPTSSRRRGRRPRRLQRPRLRRACSPGRWLLLRYHRAMELAAALWPSASRPPARCRAAAGAAPAAGARRRWGSRTGWRLPPDSSKTPPTRTPVEGATPVAGEIRPCGGGSWCVAADAGHGVCIDCAYDWGSIQSIPIHYQLTARPGCGPAY
jgi:hypothetical protein